MAKIRKIVVAGKVYFWRFRYQDQNYSNTSYLLLFPEENRNFEIRISFSLLETSIEKFMLNEGFKARKENKEVIVNLNEPTYVAEFIFHFTQMGLDMTKSKTVTFEGEALLRLLGYEF